MSDRRRVSSENNGRSSRNIANRLKLYMHTIGYRSSDLEVRYLCMTPKVLGLVPVCAVADTLLRSPYQDEAVTNHLT